MNLKVIKKYPCGLEWSIDYDGMRIMQVKNLEDACPLHGKNCFKNGSRKKQN
jgi:hypothetical protein